MSNLWNVVTGTRLQTLIERSQVNILLPLANGVAADIELISGKIPTGTRLENNTIVGTVYEVAYDTTFNAVFRATSSSGFQDCTIEFVVTGPDSPTWQTNAGLLPVGSNNSLFILDNEIIDYQLVATDTDLSAGDELSYFIADGDGVLPPGITLSEDGKLQGYFDMLGIPYNSCNSKTSALTFDKWLCNQVLANNGIHVSKSVLINDRSAMFNTKEIVAELGLPCFVKPNDGGSSFGISKVKEEMQLIPAINRAFAEGNEVMIEAFMEGKEVTCACYKSDKEIIALPLIEIVSENEFFDYEAKYEGKSQEICPARIPDEQRDRVQEITKKIYSLLGLKGIIRVDFMLVGNEPFVIEVNTAPGMSAASLVPQMVEKYEHANLSQVLHTVVQESMKPEY